MGLCFAGRDVGVITLDTSPNIVGDLRVKGDRRSFLRGRVRFLYVRDTTELKCFRARLNRLKFPPKLEFLLFEVIPPLGVLLAHGT